MVLLGPNVFVCLAQVRLHYAHVISKHQSESTGGGIITLSIRNSYAYFVNTGTTGLWNDFMIQVYPIQKIRHCGDIFVRLVARLEQQVIYRRC